MVTLSGIPIPPSSVNLRDDGNNSSEAAQSNSIIGAVSKEATAALDASGEEPPKVRYRKLTCRVGTVSYDYQAKRKDEISLQRGSLVEILQGNCGEDGWMLARVDNQEGMVPENYVALVGDQPPDVSPSYIENTKVRLGSGGFADVYRGLYKNKLVALKIPRQGSADATSKIHEALEREALVLSRLNHENIIGFVGISRKPMLLVLELCEGRTLFSLCRHMKTAHIPTSVKWAKQVASGMNHLHNREDPLVHADLKADNILIKEKPCECGVVDSTWRFSLHQYDINGICLECGGYRLDCLTMKITDFGLSRTLKTQSSNFAGSVPWLAPEVIKHGIYSTHSDVWAYGVFMWEIFSCKIPFNNFQHNFLIFAIAHGTKALTLPDGCPEKLRAIFRACWEREPVQRARFTEIIEMLNDFEANIDPSFHWLSEDGDALKSSPEETLSYNEMQNELLAHWEAQRAANSSGPAVKPRINCKQRQRIGKIEIGQPCDFRHHLSVRPLAKEAQGSRFVVKYDDKIDETEEASPATSDNETKLNAVKKNNGIVDGKMVKSNQIRSVSNSGYTHLPSLVDSSCVDNFVFVEFPEKSSNNKIVGVHEKKTAAALNNRRNHYVRLPESAAAVSSRRNCVSPLPGHVVKRTDGGGQATLGDIYAKSKSNPDLLNCTSSSEASSLEEEGEINDSMRMAASHTKEASSSSAPHRLNRKADYVTLKNLDERCRSLEDNLDEGNVEKSESGSVGSTEQKIPIVKVSAEPSSNYDVLSFPGQEQNDQSKQKPHEEANGDENLPSPVNDSGKVRSLGRANAFRRKVTSQSGGSASLALSLRTSSTTSPPATSPNSPSPNAYVFISEEPRSEPDNSNCSCRKGPKESSTSLPANIPAIQTEMLTPTDDANSAPLLDERDNPNLQPWMGSDASVRRDQQRPLTARFGSPFPTCSHHHLAHTPTSSAPATARAKSPSPLGGRPRKASSNSQSVFYVHENEPHETCVPDTESDPAMGSGRRRSGNHKIGNIISKVTNMFGGRPPDGSQVAEPNENGERGVLEPVICHHPHHSQLNLFQRHNCALSAPVTGGERHLTLTREMPVEELTIQPTSRARNLPSLSTSNSRAFTRLQDYPERQRKRQRNGSTAASAHRVAGAPPSPCEPRSFPPSVQTLSWRVGNSNGAGVRSPNPAATPSSSANHPRISFNTVIELQSPNKSQGSAQLRPHSHISGGNALPPPSSLSPSSSGHHRRGGGDILSRPIQSFNDLRQQQQQQSAASPSTPGGSAGLFLMESPGFEAQHQRSKSTDHNASMFTAWSPSGPDPALTAGSYHSLQRQKVSQRWRPKSGSEALPARTSPVKNVQNSVQSRPMVMFNRTYVAMPDSGSNRTSNSGSNKDAELQAGGRSRHDEQFDEVNRYARDILSNARILLSDHIGEDSVEPSTTRIPLAEARNGEASAPPIPRKKTLSTGLGPQIPANLKTPTSTAPVLRLVPDGSAGPAGSLGSSGLQAVLAEFLGSSGAQAGPAGSSGCQAEPVESLGSSGPLPESRRSSGPQVGPAGSQGSSGPQTGPLRHRNEPHHSYFHQIRPLKDQSGPPQRPNTLNLRVRDSQSANGPNCGSDPIRTTRLGRSVRQFTVAPSEALAPIGSTWMGSSRPSLGSPNPSCSTGDYQEVDAPSHKPRAPIADADDFEFVFTERHRDESSVSNASTGSSSGIATSYSSSAATTVEAIPRGFVVIPKSLAHIRQQQQQNNKSMENGSTRTKITTKTTTFPVNNYQSMKQQQGQQQRRQQQQGQQKQQQQQSRRDGAESRIPLGRFTGHRS